MVIEEVAFVVVLIVLMELVVGVDAWAMVSLVSTWGSTVVVGVGAVILTCKFVVEVDDDGGDDERVEAPGEAGEEWFIVV
jgi:hypothetical protein